jgi:polysaccharide pyruvyl transferase WcaK-like protein
MWRVCIEVFPKVGQFMRSPGVSKRFKVAILGASFETQNMGVGALAAGAITSVLHARPDAEIWLVDYCKEPTVREVLVGSRTISIPLMNIRFSKRVYLKNNIAVLLAITLFAKCIPSRNLRQRMLDHNPCLQLLSSADVVASLAGGDSFSDIYGLVRLIYVWLPQLLAILLNRRVILLPQTLGPYKSRIAKVMARSIICRAAHVYSRDFEGLRTCQQLLGAADRRLPNVSFCYDVGFVLDPIKPRPGQTVELKQSSQVPLVGLNVSGLLFMGGYTRKNMFGLRTSYKDLTLAIIDHLICDENAHVILIPHVFGSEAGSESDAVACQEIYDSLKDQYGSRLHIVREQQNQNEIKGTIGTCDFFIGARMHSCIAALSQCVPAVAIAYSDKFKGVLETICTEASVVDPRTMSAEEIILSINRSFRERKQLRERLQHKMPTVIAAVLNLFKANDIQVDQEPAPQFATFAS